MQNVNKAHAFSEVSRPWLCPPAMKGASMLVKNESFEIPGSECMDTDNNTVLPHVVADQSCSDSSANEEDHPVQQAGASWDIGCSNYAHVAPDGLAHVSAQQHGPMTPLLNLDDFDFFYSVSTSAGPEVTMNRIDESGLENKWPK